MWVCSDDQCRDYLGHPNATDYHGSARVNCHDEMQEMENVECGECGSRADWCDYCEQGYFCDDHRTGQEEGDIYPTQFSNDLEWVKKKVA